MAHIERKSEGGAEGCLAQGIGLLLLIWWPYGTIIGVILLLYGATRVHKKYHCSECGNPVDGKQVKICPTCGADLTIPQPHKVIPQRQKEKAPPPPPAFRTREEYEKWKAEKIKNVRDDKVE